MGFNSPFVFAASTWIATGNVSAAIAVVTATTTGAKMELRISPNQEPFGDDPRLRMFRPTCSLVGDRLSWVIERLAARSDRGRSRGRGTGYARVSALSIST